MFKKLDDISPVALETIDKVACASLVALLVLSGGNPISPVVYRVLEKYYDVKLPTYNISELMDIIDEGNKQMAMNQHINSMKVEIDSYKKLLDVMQTKGIQYKQVVSCKQGRVQLKVEGKNNINKTKSLISGIKLVDSLNITVDYLNEEELVLTVLKGV